MSGATWSRGCRPAVGLVDLGHTSSRARPSYRLRRPGLVLALEPWLMADTADLVTDADGWTLRSATGCRTAHSEHTIAITDDGAEVLTLPEPARS